MITVSVRVAEPRDLAHLYLLLRAKAVFDGALAALTASVEEFGRAIFCEHSGCAFAVAELEGKLIGFASYYPVFSTYAAKPGLWMDDLFVDAEARSRGVGLALLETRCLRGCSERLLQARMVTSSFKCPWNRILQAGRGRRSGGEQIRETR